MKKTTITLIALSLLTLASNAFANVSDFGPGEDYYNQFPYATETSDDGDGTIEVQYRALMGESEVVVNDLKKIMVSAQLYLLPGQTYLVAYNEMLATRATVTSPWQYMPVGMCPTVMKGAWSAPADKMLLNSKISGDRATFDSRPSAKLLFTDKILSPKVKGTELIMDNGHPNAPIDMTVGRGGFCPY